MKFYYFFSVFPRYSYGEIPYGVFEKLELCIFHAVLCVQTVANMNDPMCRRPFELPLRWLVQIVYTIESILVLISVNEVWLKNCPFS